MMFDDPEKKVHKKCGLIFSNEYSSEAAAASVQICVSRSQCGEIFHRFADLGKMRMRRMPTACYILLRCYCVLLLHFALGRKY